MFEHREHENALMFTLRWTARIASVVCLAIIFLFFVGEGIDFNAVKPAEYVGLLFFPIGVMVGLVLGWREEIAGGTIAVASVAAFYLIYGGLISGRLWQGWAFLPFLFPAVIFLIHGFLSRAAHRLPLEKRV